MTGPQHHHSKSSQVKQSATIESLVRNRMALKNPDSIQQSASFVLNNRSGAVLTRRTILKSDHFNNGKNSKLALYLQGAPNFRYSDLNIYGAAQPTIGGIRTILSLLKVQPDLATAANHLPPLDPLDKLHSGAGKSSNPNKAVWVSTREEPMIYINSRPFVLRDADSPQTNMRSYLGISTSRLEQMELRLKQDCIREAARWQGLFLVHDEIEVFGGSVKAIPTFIAVDKLQIQTPREVFEDFIGEGFSLEYYRIPVSVEQAPDDAYIDAYIDIVKRSGLDSPLLFNCGMGVGRTTFAMILALLIRRAIIYRDNKLLREKEQEDMIKQQQQQQFQQKQQQLQLQQQQQGKSLLSSALVGETPQQDSQTNTSTCETQSDTASNDIPDNFYGSSISTKDDQLLGTTVGSAASAVRGLFGSLLGAKVTKASSATSLYSPTANNVSSIIMDNDPAVLNLREHHQRQHAFLRLVHVLETGLHGSNMDPSAIDIALSRGTLLTDLHSAILGHYLIISRLQSSIPHGKLAKSILDSVIDSCDTIVNLREEVLIHRVKYSHTGDMSTVKRAIHCLERYFILIAFSSYVLDNVKTNFAISFTAWLKSRQEVWHMLKLFRSKSQWQQLFRPINDLSLLTHTGFDRSFAPMNTNVELEEVVTKSRRGLVLTADTILKVDHWQQETQTDSDDVVNFRGVPGTNVFCVAQPTLKAIENIIRRVVRESNLPFNKRTKDETLNVKYDRVASMSQGGSTLENDGLESSDFNVTLPRKRIKRILWINLREEPLIYINGMPYVLRDKYVTLRNLRSYAGIASSRLEVIESRLKEDIEKETDYYGGRILLHNEDKEGNITGEWESITSDEVFTLKEIMDIAIKEISYLHNSSGANPHSTTSSHPGNEGINHANFRPSSSSTSSATHDDELTDLQFEYVRIPITAETTQSPSDFDDILRAVSNSYCGLDETAIIVNCQIGMGRSTTGAATVCLIQHWLSGKLPYLPKDYIRPRLNYPVIHSLMRTLRDGAACKTLVDDVVDSCGYLYNIRDLIEQFRQIADAETDGNQTRETYLGKASLNLRRYFLLIAFESYLMTHDYNKLHAGQEINQITFSNGAGSPPKDVTSSVGGLLGNSEAVTIRSELEMESFGKWISRFEEIKSMSELISKQKGHEAIIPVEQNIKAGDGVALDSEVMRVVEQRNGSILAKGTILKFDIFPGAQKMTLPDKIDGAPNYRRISLKALRHIANSLFSNGPQGPEGSVSSALSTQILVNGNDEINTFRDTDKSGAAVYGVGMPTEDGVKKVLARVGADPTGKRTLIWTCLREEPVIYVNGLPYVLRLSNEPITNLEATGITTERVEYMEEQMKKDILSELKLYNGRVLLHSEQVEELPNGGRKFTIVPNWETVEPKMVQTSSDVYESIVNLGYKVEYFRIPVTDEQAPIPKVFDELINRMFLHSRGNTDIMYNCQMGRGRTTTGIIITCLMEMIIGNKHLVKEYLHREKEGQRRTLDDDERVTASIDYNSTSRAEFMETMDQKRERYLQGEYKIILKLVSVLQYGKLAKLLTDKVIDLVDHMQNLRTAIYDYKSQQYNLEEVLLEKLNPKGLVKTGSTGPQTHIGQQPAAARRISISHSQAGEPNKGGIPIASKAHNGSAKTSSERLESTSVPKVYSISAGKSSMGAFSSSESSVRDALTKEQEEIEKKKQKQVELNEQKIQQQKKLLKLSIEEIQKRLSTVKAVGSNYLMRYFYLIVFADYLLEEWTEWARAKNDHGRHHSAPLNQESGTTDLGTGKFTGSPIHEETPNSNYAQGGTLSGGSKSEEDDEEMEIFTHQLDEATKVGESVISVAAANLQLATPGAAYHHQQGDARVVIRESDEPISEFDNKDPTGDEVFALDSADEPSTQMDKGIYKDDVSFINRKQQDQDKPRISIGGKSKTGKLTLDPLNGSSLKSPHGSQHRASWSAAFEEGTTNTENDKKDKPEYYRPHFHNEKAVTFENWLDDRRELSTLASKGGSAFD